MVTRIKVCIIGAVLIQLAVAGYSSAQSLYVTVERDIFEVGAPIRASAKVENVEEKEVEWVFVASLLSKDPRAPVPRSFVKRVQLEPGEQAQIPISMSTEGLIYEGEYELISGLYDIARKPIAKSTQKIRLRGGMKRLDIEFKMCKDSACETPARMFVQGETVYVNYITKVETPLIEASLVLPDQSKTNLTLPAAIVVEQEGDYQVNAVITKPGYQTVKKFFMFGVIEAIHPWLGISIKDTGAYKDKEVFIIADTDWKNVLSLVPVTVWTDSMIFKLKVRKYPTLIYHQEGSKNLDVDSIIHFLQQYRPSRVTIVEPLPKTLGLLLASHSSTQFGAGLSFKQFRFITPADYLSYWKKYNTVVYAADNYDIALIAATYASLINAPLIIKNSKLDTPANLKGKRIICVGKMQPMIGCVESYNKSSLLKRYLELTGASEVVLVNSKDLKLGMPGQFQPEKTPVPIGTTFSKLSLGAPILASARHALLLSINLDANDCGPYEGTSNTQFIATDEYVKEILEDLYGSYHLPSTKPKPGFLTIVASPKAIPYWSDCNNSYSGAADWQYGSINNEDPNLHVGRIYSTTISGVSAYIARTLFYKQVLNNAYTANTYTGLTIAAPNFTPDQDNAQQIRDETVDDGYNSICFTWHGAASQPNCDVYTNIQSTDYQDKQFISFADHGSSTGWGGTLASDDISWLDIPYTISLACQTNNFWGGGSLTFGPTWIRKGGISYHASIPSTNGYDWELWAIQELTSAQRQSLGEMATNLINRTDYTSEVKRQYILLGDPTLVPYAKEVTWTGIDMDVDADRDGIVENSLEDDIDEHNWAIGSGNKGAIVLVNSDDDDNDNLPDNWAVHSDISHDVWDSEPNDNLINADPDAEDIAPLIVRKIDLEAFPADASIILSVNTPTDDPAYFSGFFANERIRIFHPNQISGSDHIYTAGAQEIIGPEQGARIEFVNSPGPTQRDISVFLGDGDVKFGIEGIVHGSMIDVLIEYRVGAGMHSKDKVRIRTAPFILYSHVTEVNTLAGAGETVFVENLGGSNVELRDALNGQFGSDHVDEADTGDRWHQDGYDPGYQAAPYKTMPMIFGLPRGQRSSDRLNRYAQNELLRPDVGIVYNFQYLRPWSGQDDGGNLEAIPGAKKFFHGNVMQNIITDFLSAQGVQTEKELDTSFLAVGHVDELVSFAPDGRHVMVSSPEMAWALLLIARDINEDAIMLQGVSPVGPAGMAVSDVMDTYGDYNFNVVLDPFNLPRFRNDLGLGSAASPPKPDSANASDQIVLSKVGGLIGFMDGNSIRTFKLTFSSGTDFDLEYQDSDGPWQSDGSGHYGKNFISNSRTAFILDRWWRAESPESGDIYTFTVSPRSSFIEVPVIFRDAGGALAFTKNNVNSLVSGETIITSETVGPVVDWGEGAQDIFGFYIESILTRAGYTNIQFTDEMLYHNTHGSIHCATNVLRRNPERNWWE